MGNYSSRDKAMFDDASKEFASDLQLSLWEPREELVLLKHVLQHTHKQVLRQTRQGERERETYHQQINYNK